MAEGPPCRCHGVPTKKTGEYWRCRIKNLAIQARYRQTAKGRAVNAKVDRRRVRIADTTIRFPTEDLLRLGKELIRRRRCEFVTRFTNGAETKSAPSRAIPTEAELRPD